MDAPGAAGSLEELSATEPLPAAGEPAPDAGSRPVVPAAEVALVRRAKVDEVSFAQQVGVFIGMVFCGLGLLLPVAVLLWGAVSIGVSALAGTALVHTGGLEARSFGPAMLIGLSIAAVLLIWVAIRWAADRAPVDVVSPTGRVRRRPEQPTGARVLGTMAALVAASLVTTLAGSAHSPFFPYPLATVCVVATVAFVAVVAFVAGCRALTWLWQVTWVWAGRGHYRAGFLTATLVILGAAGVWAQQAGWTERPLTWVAREAELGLVHGPDGVVDAGERLLCLGAGEIEPGLARSSAAPACSFLPGARASTAQSRCFETLMAQSYEKAVGIVKAMRTQETDAEDLVSDAVVKTCTRQELPDDLEDYLFAVARNAAKHYFSRRGRETSCDSLEQLAASSCGPLDTVEQREAKLTYLAGAVMCRLKPDEREVAERYLHGQRYREIDEALGYPNGRAKNKFNYAMDRLKPMLKDVLEVCRIE